ncbi:MAG: hypothetical protein V4632_23900 [Pseudomonadota bacterium]
MNGSSLTALDEGAGVGGCSLVLLRRIFVIAGYWNKNRVYRCLAPWFYLPDYIRSTIAVWPTAVIGNPSGAASENKLNRQQMDINVIFHKNA